MIWRVRRVLTGHDAEGRSTFIADATAPNMKEMPSSPGLGLTDLWETKGAPASNAGGADAADPPMRLEPPRNGTMLRIVEFPPRSTRPKEAVRFLTAAVALRPRSPGAHLNLGNALHGSGAYDEAVAKAAAVRPAAGHNASAESGLHLARQHVTAEDAQS